MFFIIVSVGAEGVVLIFIFFGNFYFFNDKGRFRVFGRSSCWLEFKFVDLVIIVEG